MRTTVELVLSHVADTVTCEALLRYMINPAFETNQMRLTEKIDEILRPHQRGHPITYNHYFTETVQKAKQEHMRENQRRSLAAYFPSAGHGSQVEVNFDDLVQALNPATEHDMELFACSEATYCMEAYYRVSFSTLSES